MYAEGQPGDIEDEREIERVLGNSVKSPKKSPCGDQKGG
jgi:hypothetical protein